MVRLVFRPYTQIWRSICTSEPLRASTAVSGGFTLFRHSSPSFGSQHVCSHSDRSPEGLRPADCAKSIQPLSLSLRTGVCHPCTRTYVRLLGPCFKTGKRKPFCLTQLEPMPAVKVNSLQALPKVSTKQDIGQATAPKPRAAREVWFDLHWFPSLPFQRFQVLFNSLFKVLCIFPSRYLYAIGLPPIFSFRWNLPPALSCNPKQLDSLISISSCQAHGSFTL